MRVHYNIILLLLSSLLLSLYTPINSTTLHLASILTQAELPVPFINAAVELAVKTVNNEQLIGYGVNFTIEVIDDEGSEVLAFEKTLRLLSRPQPTTAIIGAYFSSTTRLMSLVSNEYEVPQISATATSSELGDRTTYKYFARTIPPDSEQASAIANIIKTFNWSNVGVLFTTDVYATGLQSYFELYSAQRNINIVAKEQFSYGAADSVISAVLKTIQNLKIKIIVMFMQVEDAIRVFKQAKLLGMLSPANVWIGPDSMDYLTFADPKDLRGLIVTSAPRDAGTPARAQFFNALSSHMGQTIEDNTTTSYAAQHYDIVFLYAYAINKLLTAHGSYYNFSGAELYNATLNTSFAGVANHIQFTETGEYFPASFNILNWRDEGFVNAGIFTSESQTPPPIIFNSGTNKPPSDALISVTIPIALIMPFAKFSFVPAYRSIIRYAFDKMNRDNFIDGRTLILLDADDLSDPAAIKQPGQAAVKGVDMHNLQVVAVVGSLTSGVTQSIASVLSAVSTPLLNFASTSTTLSNRALYPYFARNVPSDASQTLAIASVVNKFGWKKVITINTLEEYGIAAVQAFNNLFTGAEVVYTGTFQVAQNDLSELMRQVAKADSYVIVTFVNLDDCPRLFQAIRQAGLMADGYVWIHSDTCSSWGRNYDPNAYDATLGSVMTGMLGVVSFAGEGDEYNNWVQELASLNPIDYPGLSDVPTVPYSSHCYDIPFILATAIKSAIGVGADINNGSLLLQHITSTTYEGITGTNAFDSQGNRIGRYNLVSWNSSASTQFSIVGGWDPITKQVTVTAATIPWLGTTNTYPSYQYTPRGYPLAAEDKSGSMPVAVIAIIAVLGSLLVIAIVLIVIFWIRRHRHNEKKYIPALSWDDEPLLRNSMISIKSEDVVLSVSQQSVPESQSESPGLLFRKSGPQVNVELSKTELKFGLSDNDRFPIDKKKRDQVTIKCSARRKYKVFVPNDPARFICQVYPGEGELRKNQPLTLKIKFKLLLMTRVRRRIKIEVEGYPEPLYLSLNFKGDVSDKIDPDELEIQGDPIGEGGFGVVYKGLFRGTEVAVKTAHAKNEAVPAFKEEFLRELDMMRRLHHPNIITFIGASFIPGKMGIISEYCKRGSLARLIHSGNPLPYGLKIKIALDISNGMNFLHENGVLHRDLKPDISTNYLEQVCAKLTDFGTAKAVNLHQQNHAHTQAIGTPIYMAPEILQRTQYSTKVDVFSYGILLWELYSQLHPYHFIRLHWDIPGFVIGGNRNPIASDCPADLRDLINRCWLNNPADRPTFAQVSDTLNKMLLPIKSKSRTLKFGRADTGLQFENEESVSVSDDTSAASDSRNTTTNSQLTGGNSNNNTTNEIELDPL